MDDLVAGIREDLRAIADPRIASGQQAYMRSTMAFLGVRVPAVRGVAQAQGRGIRDASALQRAALTLWDEAEFREERYAALALLGLRPLRGDFDLLPLVEHMVRTGRWWDITDELAHRVAELLDAHPDEMALILRSWSVDEDMWMRRLAVIGQLGRRDRLDPELLSDVIEQNADDPESFIRKAIGWALRDAARTRPDFVRAFVASHQLSALSTREALKHL